ncbi:unnamed protein product [Mytilus coruscus]|uniref:Uncharacterized protein n=1 Tax=Mytilus coruscus TaxID=42192 RepID=A0A6J8D082_MYTCO|nr:unnamed protein product [Mytilus coruscus]
MGNLVINVKLVCMVHGALSLVSVMTVRESTVLVKDTPTVTEYNVIGPTTLLSPTIKLFTFKGKDPNVTISAKRITSTTKKSKALDIGLQNREIIVYSICASAFLFVILLCTACQRRYKLIYDSFRRYQAENRRSRNIPEVPFPDIPLVDIEGIYEVIDESNMINNIEYVRDSISSVTDTNEGYCQSDTNDYLTPCHPVVEGSNICNSSDDTSEYSATLNVYLATKSDCQSTSSSSYGQERESSYLNPYPSIVDHADIDTQGYVFTHNTNDTGSSWLEAQLRDSTYLNPYQTMVSDRDLHEYKSVLGCSDESDSLLSDTCSTEIGVKIPHPNQDLRSDIDINEHKSANGKSCDTVSTKLDMMGGDPLEKINIQNEEPLANME